MVVIEESLKLELQNMDRVEEPEEQDQSQQGIEAGDESPESPNGGSEIACSVTSDNAKDSGGVVDQHSDECHSYGGLNQAELNQRKLNIESTNQQQQTGIISSKTVMREEGSEQNDETASRVLSSQEAQMKDIWKNIKFYVRNLEGHNDLICDVDCRGPILVSGRFVPLIHRAIF